MIKICSFFHLPVERERIGPVYAISNSTPRNVRGITAKLHFFVPPWKIVKQYKADHDQKAFTDAYRTYVSQNGRTILNWLDTLQPDDELYLCCWEPQGFCHRQLVAKFIRHFRPDLEVRLT